MGEGGGLDATNRESQQIIALGPQGTALLYTPYMYMYNIMWLKILKQILCSIDISVTALTWWPS